MNTSPNPERPQVDRFLMAAEARFDRWRALLQSARLWERATNQNQSAKGEHHAAVSNCFEELGQWEDFFAYPGLALLKSLGDHISSGDATGTVRLSQSISAALLTHSYRTTTADWEGEEEVSINFGERVTGTGEETAV